MDLIVVLVLGLLACVYLLGCAWMFCVTHRLARALAVILVVAWAGTLWFTYSKSSPSPGDLWQWGMVAETVIALIHLWGLWRNKDAIEQVRWTWERPRA